MSIFADLKPEFYYTVIYVITAFILYYTITGLVKKRLKDQSIKSVLLSRFIGVLFFAIIPLAVLLSFNYTLGEFGLNFKHFSESLLWAIASLPLIFIARFNSKKEDNLKTYPEIRIEKWSLFLLAISGITLVLYTLAYEILFRGVFLFMSGKYMTTLSAIILNTVLYAIVHIPKGKKESFASIPFGLLICFISLKTQSMIAGFMIHSIMALSNEWFSLRAHPEMRLSLKQKNSA